MKILNLKQKISIFALVFFALPFMSFAQNQTPPTVTSGASNITQTYAKADILFSYYDPTTSLIEITYGEATPDDHVINQKTEIVYSLLADGPFLSPSLFYELSNLKQNTTYNYIIKYKVIGFSLITSPVFSFKTLPNPALDFLLAPKNIKENEAEIDAKFLGPLISGLQVGVEYGIRGFSSNSGPLSISGEELRDFSFLLPNLNQGTTYQYRMYDVNDYYYPSHTATFTTAGSLSINAVSQAYDMTSTSARISGFILNTNPGTRHFRIEYGEGGSYDLKTDPLVFDINGNFGPITLSNLKSNTTYNQRLADDDGVFKPSASNTFKTQPVASSGSSVFSLANPYKGLVPKCNTDTYQKGEKIIMIKDKSGQEKPVDQIGEFKNPCDFAYLMILVKNVIRFAIFDLSLPVATIAFVYGGYLLMTSGDDPGNRKKAKSMIIKVFAGLAIAMAAWVVVNTILTSLIPADRLQEYSLLKTFL